MSTDLVTATSNRARSAQSDVIDFLIWNNLSRFWSKGYNPDDRAALSSIYEAMFTVLDAEYVRLYEINDAKSITKCPVFSQRRWLRFDLYKYDQVRAFLRFLRAGVAGLTGELPGNVLACADVPTYHTKHWHISFPWKIPDGPEEQRSLLKLSFPINTIALIDIYEVYEGADGIKRGRRLGPKTADDSIGWEFELLSDGSTIHFRNPVVNREFEVFVGFDFGTETYKGLRPIVHKVDTFLGAGICQVPTSMSNAMPVHALIVHTAPDVGTVGLEVTNTDDFETQRTFIPFTGDFTGVQHGSKGKVVLPRSVNLSANDVVFLFGSEAGEFNTIHAHKRDSTSLDRTQLLSGVLTTFSPGVQIPLGMFGSIDFIGQQLQLFVNGRLIHPSEYSYEYASNTFFFRKPIPGATKGPTFIDVLYTDEIRVGSATSQPYHIHQQCYRGDVQVPKQFATFDDGGEFDDEDINPPATFDDYDYDNTIFINDLVLTADQIEVFVNGSLMVPGLHYVVTQEPKRTRLSFSIPLMSQNVLVSIIRDSLVYVYGLDDIIPSTSVYGVTTDTLRNILSDLTNVVRQFEAYFGQKVDDLATLLEAAFIAAGGGNPMLALFHDEFREYDGLPLDADGQALSALEARIVESANTKLIDIPFFTDHTIQSTVRLVGGADFKVVNGNIQSSVDLTAQRSDEDDQPGVWWCPLVILDENMLSKNFGAIAADIRFDSSLSYRNALAANISLRYNGPTMQALSNAAAILLGSPMFTQDSKILSISPRLVKRVVTVTAVTGTRQEVFELAPEALCPQLGATVYPGQSIAFPVIADLKLTRLHSWDGGVLVLDYDLSAIRTGDRARISVFSPNDSRARAVSVEVMIQAVHSRPTINGIQTVITFDQRLKFAVTTESQLRVFRDYGIPRAGFEGTVTSITPVNNTVIATEFEEFELTPDQKVEYKVGDSVFRGMPVRPSLAIAYDHDSQPNWHWITPAQWRNVLDYSIQENTFGYKDGLVSEKYGSISVVAGKMFSRVDLADLGFMPDRGITVEFVDDATQLKSTFRVFGKDGTSILTVPPVNRNMSGLFTFRTSPEFQKLDYQREYFEVAPAMVRNKAGELTLPTVYQTYAQQAGSPVVECGSLSGFPQMGRVNIRLANGGLVEFEYYSRTDTRFLNCHWTSPFTALHDQDNILNPVLPLSAEFLLVAEYRTRRLNPAFTAVVPRRATSIDKHNTGPVSVTDANADEFYALLKGSVAVLELRSVQEPDALDILLEDTMPPGSTVEVVHKDALVDTARFGLSDKTLPYDSISVTMVTQVE